MFPICLKNNSLKWGCTPTDASDSHIDSHSPPTTLLVNCHSTSLSERTASPAPKTVTTDACQNCGTTRSPEGLRYFSTLASGWRICQACYAYERQHKKHHPPELEARLQSQVCLGGADPEFKNSSASPSASVAISARASGPTVVPHQICSNCRALTGSYVRPSALTPGWGICGHCNRYERRHKKSRPPELEAARQSRVAVNLGDTKPQCVNCCMRNMCGCWRYSKLGPGRLCRACYEYERRHKTYRPRALFEGTTKKRMQHRGASTGMGNEMSPPSHSQ
jgi:hypothetical protein